MIDDSEELERELAWSPRKKSSWGSRDSRPPGASAIFLFGLVYTLALWGVTLAIAGSVSGRPSGDVVSPGACFSLVVLGLEMFIAQMLASQTWRALGPAGRAVVRPLMFFGPWPAALVFGFAALMLINVSVNGLPKPRPKVGDNWKFFELRATERQGVTFDQASVRCMELGDSWRVPTETDLANMKPAFEGAGSAYFWIDAEPPQLRSWSCRKGVCELAKTLPGSATYQAQVVCFLP